MNNEILKTLHILGAIDPQTSVSPVAVIVDLVARRIGTVPDGTVYLENSAFGQNVKSEFMKLHSERQVVYGYKSLSSCYQKWYVCTDPPSVRRSFGNMNGNMWSEFDANGAHVKPV